MNENLLSIVKRIITENGEGVLGDPARLKAFFSDLARDEPKPLRIAFGRCIESGAYEALKTAPEAAERASRKVSIAQSLRDEHGLDLNLCGEALDILEASLFGTAQPTYTPPPPPQTYQPPPSYQQPNPYQPPPSYQQSPQGTADKNLWQYFTGAFKKYAVFRGRARRAEYWGFLLFNFLAFFLASMLDALIFGTGIGLFYILWLIAVFLPAWSVMVRRYHDVDKRAWWCLVPVYGFILLFYPGTAGPNRFGPDPKQGAPVQYQNPVER